MTHAIIQFFTQMPAEWAVFWLSMLPITELRASVPIGLEVFGLSVVKTWVIAVIGNTLPTIVILLLMPKLHDWLVQHRVFGGVVRKKLAQAEQAFTGKYKTYGLIALVLFVGTPLPFTGAWTGSLAAFIFRIPFRRSFPLIVLGICLAATLVTIITLSAGGAFRFFAS